jgi:acyl-CoA thioesterase-1
MQQSWKQLLLSVCLAVLGLLSRSYAAEPTHVLFLGDSLTAGYGIEQEAAFPARVRELAARNGLAVTIVNAGMSGDTSAGGLRRLPWLLKRKVDIAVVALGANDGLRGLPVSELRRNLAAIIDSIREKYPAARVVLAGMRLPENIGADYIAQFESVYPELAREKETIFIPFLLEGVAGVSSLNLPDRLHPSAEGHEIIADTVWKALEPLLKAA